MGGNAVSSGLLMILPPIALILKNRYYWLSLALKPHEIWLDLTALFASLVVFFASFAWRCAKPTTAFATDQGKVEEPHSPGKAGEEALPPVTAHEYEVNPVA